MSGMKLLFKVPDEIEISNRMRSELVDAIGQILNVDPYQITLKISWGKE